MNEKGDVDLDGDIILPAEGTARNRPDNAYLVLAHAEHDRNLAPVAEGTLVRRPYDQIILCVPHADARFGLDVSMVNHLGPVRVLDDHVRLGEAGSRITLAELCMEQEIPFFVDT